MIRRRYPVLPHVPRLFVRLVALALVAAACTSGSDVSVSSGESAAGSAEHVAATCDDDGQVDVPRTEPSPSRDVPSALDDRFDESFPEPLVDPDEIISGGPPPDGIPPIDEPKFVRQCSVDWLTGAEPVLSLEIGDEARAYPLRIMTWHELVNDTVGNIPVTVSYCPLCNSAVAYDRRVDGDILDFGTSGRLFKSSLVMYDRQTESLWSHFTSEAIVGVMTGTELEIFPMQTISFSDFRTAHPEGLVLTDDTGFSRDYGRNPYSGYDDPESTPFLFEGEFDDILAAKTRIVGVEHEDAQTALVLTALLEQRVAEFEVGGDTLVALAKPGTASALDTSNIPEGRDVGSTGVFDPVIDGEKLTFTAEGDQFIDDRTGSTWDILGRAVAGPLEGTKLTAIDHLDTFWFAWSSFHTETSIALR